MPESELFKFAVGLAREQAARFGKPRPPLQIAPRIDPAGWADSTIEGAANDLIFAANEAKLAGDVETLLQIQQIADARLIHLKTVEDLAIKYADDVLRARGK